MFLNIRIANNTTRSTIVIDDAKTVREAFAEAGIECTGMIMLNGASLTATEIGQPLSSFNLPAEGTNFINAVAKLDNAVECRVLADTAVISTILKEQDFALIKQYRPEALLLKKDKETVFRIDCGATGSISAAGAMFVPSADGSCRIQVALPANCGTKEFITKTYGRALSRIQEIEMAILNQSVIEEIESEKAEIEGLIEIM